MSKSSNSTVTDTDSSARAKGNTASGVCWYFSHRSSHVLFVRLAHRQLYDVMKEICQAEPSLDTLHSSVCSNRISVEWHRQNQTHREPLDKVGH